MHSAPEIERHWSLFLDIDGTLLDIAPTPDQVTVPPGLPPCLGLLHRKLGGALALVSGRALANIDDLFDPLYLPAAAEHGAVIRYSSGRLVSAPRQRMPPEGWREALRQAAQAWPGVVIEEKSYSIAAHFRLAPQYEAPLRRAVEELIAMNPGDFELLNGKELVEIRPRSITKGHATALLAESAPFKGRRPVFVGDDITDEDGFAMARQLGGLGLHVGQSFQNNPAAVRGWLLRAADRLV